ncbi:MAG: hypothetical protein C0391_03795 [Anaerolinea sp.]|nr:hypothetical protein [Anaerolinea sp.]
MSEEVCLENDMSRFGLRRLHVICLGEPVKIENWTQHVPMSSIHTCSSVAWVEKPVGMHHLQIYWKAREVVKIFDPSTGSGDKELVVVMWWIDVKAGDTIRTAADDAACFFSAMYPWMPTKAALSNLPKGIENKKLDEPFQNIEFIEMPWVPKSFVAVW